MNPSDLKVEDLMSVALVVAHANDSVYRARQQMRYADIRHLPVVDDEHRLTGIVSDRDLLRPRRADRPLRIRDVMTRRVHSMAADAPAREAAEIMLEHHIHALPVTGTDGHLVGLVTETDFLRHWLRNYPTYVDASDMEPALTYSGLPGS
jgi:CBS domain-containing membrane protein